MSYHKFCSIIFVHYGKDEQRSELMKRSIDSLITSLDYPAEIIVVDNGPDRRDTEFFIEKLMDGKINTYIRNAENMHFGYARNQGMRLAQGDFICITDNDVIFKPSWLSNCIKVLEAYPEEKIWATPIYNVAHWLPKYWEGELEVDGQIYRLNRRAGSNCWVMRREDMEIIGEFYIHRVAGTKWTEKANRLGYHAAVTPELLIKDEGFRHGYDYKVPLLVKETLQDGTQINFNQDEYSELYGEGMDFIDPRRFKQERAV